MKTSTPTKTAKRSSLQWGKLGLPIVIVGFLSYFMFFAKFPLTRDFPWVSLPLMLVGLWVAFRYHWQNRKSPSRGSKIFSSMLLTGAALIVALFCFYVFSYSYQLPDAGNGIALNEVPREFTLKDHTGKDVRLSDYLGSYVVLSFYRGHW